MRRDEILLEAYHIRLKGNFGLSIHLSPFDNLLQDFYEIVWATGRDKAVLLVAESNTLEWRRREGKPIHREFWEKPIWKVTG